MLRMVVWPKTGDGLDPLRVTDHAFERWDERGGAGRGEIEERVRRAKLKDVNAARFHPNRKGRAAYYVSGKLSFLVVKDRDEYVVVTLVDRLKSHKDKRRRAKLARKVNSRITVY